MVVKLDKSTDEEQIAITSENRIKRDEVRRKIAEARLASELCEKIRAAITASEQRKEDLASEHVTKCAPWQTELAEIEQQSIDEILGKKPHDDDREARREELLGLIRQANIDLQAGIEREDRLIGQLQLEIKEKHYGVSVSTLEHELFELAPKQMRLRYRVLAAAAERAERYRDALHESTRMTGELKAAAIEFAEAEAARLVAMRDVAFEEAVNF